MSQHDSRPIVGEMPVFSDDVPAPRAPDPTFTSTSTSDRTGPQGTPPTSDYANINMRVPSPDRRLWCLPTSAGSGFDTTKSAESAGGSGESGCSGTTGRSADFLVFNGALIGVSVTDHTHHICPFPGGYAPTSLRCTGCRWFETRLFRLTTEDSTALAGTRFVLHHVGRSIVPGEVDFARHELARGGHEVIEAYTMRRPGERPFITKPGAKVLAQAASLDEDVEDAYVNRATA